MRLGAGTARRIRARSRRRAPGAAVARGTMHAPYEACDLGMEAGVAHARAFRVQGAAADAARCGHRPKKEPG